MEGDAPIVLFLFIVFVSGVAVPACSRVFFEPSAKACAKVCAPYVVEQCGERYAVCGGIEGPTMKAVK